jgi:two-component system sensor histidine kinase BaeS
MTGSSEPTGSTEPGASPAEGPGGPGGPHWDWGRHGRPPWGPWRADGGSMEPWGRRNARYREMRRRARLARRGDRSRPWHRRQGFGCIFAILFMVVVGSIVTATASFLSHLGPIPVVIAVLAVVAIAAALLRGVAGAARDLDAMLAATRRVQEGDYSVRLRTTRSDLPPVQELARGFDTMAARLEADEEQRRTLLADVSHELRTPLAVITGNLEAIVDGVYPPDPAHLTSILEETRVMERLIEDLRTVALSEAGTLALHPEPTDPDVLIGEVLHAFGPGATAAGVTLATASAEDLPILDIDPVRIREVLSNLVANALRHTPSGGTITVGGSSTAASVVLTVGDTGPGIAPELLPHVFDRFVKGAGSRGSGLGLAIARGLVEAHGGTITVESPAGGGTTFRVELPRNNES